MKKVSVVKRIFLVILIILITAAVAFGVDLFISYHALGVTEYTVSSQKISEDIHIIILSDLHDSRFGRDNRRLINKVAAAKPDLILTVGDMVSNYTDDIYYLGDLYSSLSEIAPTYCSLGNHELTNEHFDEIVSILESSSSGLLHNEYTEISINGNSIRLGGLMGYHPADTKTNEFVDEYSDTDMFTMLMCHCPEYYIWGVDERKTDLMLCGHTHGGQVILPFKGGVYAPEQGFFPHFDYGVFHEENSTLVVSRGLGTSKQPAPRFNNPPEIVHLTLTPEA